MAYFIKSLTALACSLCLLSACATYTQTTSGADYLRNASAAGVDLSEEMKASANIEPLLTFPARIGIARIENGALTDIPADELENWQARLSEQAGNKNEFVPVSLFVTDLVAPRIEPPADAAFDRNTARGDIIKRLQLGGARQHLEAILVYEVYGKASRRQSALAIADWTIIGAYLTPGRKVDAEGHASALLFDVRNGYPYGSTSATVTRKKLTQTAYAHARSADLLSASQSAAVADLSLNVAEMMTTLTSELEKKPASREFEPAS